METILEIKNLKTHFFTKAGLIKAVDDISFKIKKGEIVGLVGESGSGKSITGFSIIGLIDAPGRIVSGSINFKNEPLLNASSNRMQSLRGNRLAMIFQDPMMTLNPVLRIFLFDRVYPKLGISSFVLTKFNLLLNFLHNSATSFTVTESLVKL